MLDLGCGYGPLTCALGALVPTARVVAVDVNERALELARTNVARLGLDNVIVVEPDDVPDDLRFDAIWSNPPVHVGKTSLHELLSRWLARLAPDGTAWLVVHKHLGSDSLQRWLASRGWPTTRVASERGYRVLSVRSQVGAAGRERPDSGRGG